MSLLVPPDAMHPDFFILGAPRSGTTSLAHYLNQHPRVRMSTRKEPGYFHFVDSQRQPDFASLAISHGTDLLAESQENYFRARTMAVSSPEKYSELWVNAPADACRGEATPTYLCDPVALISIRERVTRCKSLIVLRNPIERAYSEYLQHLGKGLEDAETFPEALSLEPVKVGDFWWGSRSYIRSGFYVDHVIHAVDLFGSENVLILLTDDLAKEPQHTLERIARFLEVDPDFEFDTSTKHNPAYVPKPDLAVRVARSDGLLRTTARQVLPDKVRSRLWRKIMRRGEAEKPILDGSTRASLVSVFRPSVGRLSTVIDRDLSHWLE